MDTSGLPSYLSGEASGPWANYLEQIRRVRPYLGKLADLAESLTHPKRCVIVDVPVRMDDGSIAHFEGYRVQHNVARGPGKGGVRFHQNVTLSDVMALAAWMSIKNAAINLPFGGAKGGVRVDPRQLSMGELERLTRRYTSEIYFIIGPDKDIPAPDMNTNEQIMAWMMDTYSMNEGRTVTGVVTGKPLAMGGSLGRHDATGRGVFVVAAEAARKRNMTIAGSRCVIQGLGNVGYSAARLFHQNGAKVVAIQTVDGAVYSEKGIDPVQLNSYIEQHKTLTGFPGAEPISAQEFWQTETDFLVPAALESQITKDNAGSIRAKILVEGANGPTTPEADDILRDKDVLVVPDVLANAGGVTVSYFEWVQDFSSFFWSEDEINARLDRIMTEAFNSIWAVAEGSRVSLRTATFIVACQRILQAWQLRGLYP